jgi:phage terminase small subunit
MKGIKKTLKGKSKGTTHGSKSCEKRRKKFISYYIQTYNATEAAKLAGFSQRSAHSQGSRLLKNADVQAAIEAEEHKLETKVGVTKQRVIKELSLIGFSSIDEHLDIDSGGTIRAKSFDEMPPGAVRAIKKIKEKRTIKAVQGTKDKPSEDVVLESQFEFELYDKPQALINIGKELGMFRDKVEHTGKDGGPIETKSTIVLNPLERATRVAFLLAKAVERKEKQAELADKQPDTEKQPV